MIDFSPVDDLIPAVAYLRMSSDEQCASIEQQRKELTAWAGAHGYRIIREYVDEGRSGSKDQEKRVAFQRMLVDSDKQDFKAVLCWNTSRFGRLDSIDSSFGASILRNNGIWLHTIRDGKIDWTTFQGRMMAALKAELDHLYSQNLSADTLRGRMDAVECGWWAVGPIPYGYDKLLVDIKTGAQSFHRRTERVSKGKNVRVRLVVNKEEAEVVRWIYRQVVADKSQRWIVAELNRRQIPVPADWYRKGETEWTWDSVKGILRHKAYLGIASIGGGRKRAGKAFNRSRHIETGGAHEAIITDRAVWDEVQARLAKNREENRRPQTERAGILSGCLLCSKCGYRLKKQVRQYIFCLDCARWLWKPRKAECRYCGSTRRKMRERICYVCPSSTTHVPGCPRWGVFEDELLPVVVREVIQIVNAQLAAALLPQDEQDPPSDLAVLKDHRETLQRRYDAALEQLLDPDLPNTLKADIKARAAQLRQEVDAVGERIGVLEAVENQGGVESFKSWFTGTSDDLLAYAQSFNWFPRSADPNEVLTVSAEFVDNLEGNPLVSIATPPDHIRAVLRRLGVSVSVSWKKQKQRYYQVDFSEVVVKCEWFGQEGESSQECLVQGISHTRPNLPSCPSHFHAHRPRQAARSLPPACSDAAAAPVRGTPLAAA